MVVYIAKSYYKAWLKSGVRTIDIHFICLYFHNFPLFLFDFLNIECYVSYSAWCNSNKYPLMTNYTMIGKYETFVQICDWTEIYHTKQVNSSVCHV